jgi:hypothetical protein
MLYVWLHGDGPMMGCSVESSLAMHVVCKPCNVDAADAHLISGLRSTIATVAANADLCARAAEPESSHTKKTKDPTPLSPKPAAATTCATCNTPAIGHDYCAGCMRCSSCAHDPLTGAKVNLKDLQADGSSRYVECIECDDTAELAASSPDCLSAPATNSSTRALPLRIKGLKQKRRRSTWRLR